ncbi:MAG: GFA family protein [Pseudomonadota bacterium]
MRYKGQCECGAVQYKTEAKRRDVTICHCGHCQRTSGHAWASVSVPLYDLSISGENEVRWYRSSDTARRGFCRTCGSSLFFEPLGAGRMAIAAGTLQQPSGLKTGKRIFLADKGDHYEINCTAPQFEHYE